MSSKVGWYAKGVEHIMKGDVAFLTDTIKACLIDEAQYTVDMDVHESLSEVPSGARKGAVALSGISVTGGILGCTSPITFGVIAAGPELNGVLFYKDSGTSSTSWLLAFVSGSYAVGFPKTPDGATAFKYYARTTGTKLGKLGGHT